MVYCTFCGLSNCKDCTKKTRIFPNSQPDPETGKRTKRGTICKMCDRKFFVKSIVQVTSKQISVQTSTIADTKKKLQRQCDDIQFDIKEDEYEQEAMLNQIDEADQDLDHI